MASFLPYIQVVLSILLVGGILIQRSEAGLGAAFGMDTLGMHYARRGFERLSFHLTIIFAILFAASVFASLIISH